MSSLLLVASGSGMESGVPGTMMGDIGRVHEGDRLVGRVRLVRTWRVCGGLCLSVLFIVLTRCCLTWHVLLCTASTAAVQ